MSEPRTIEVKDGGFVSLERGPAAEARTRLEVATADRTVALGVILTSDETVALALELLRLAGRPGAVRVRWGFQRRGSPCSRLMDRTCSAAS